jgi:hypothetical protein
MPASIHCDSDDVCVLHISGMLKRSEFAAQQELIAQKIDAGAKPRLLVILEEFEGWERRVDWNDLDFLIAHSGEIAKIAIVSEPRWEAHALAFAGAGVRRAPVKIFLPDQQAEARAWIME